MPTASNRRRFTRLPFDAFATLETSSGRYRAQVLDLSLHGALLLTPDGFEPRVGDEATIEISLSDE
ncbi:PilZ domain-containing protein, partial [Bacillus atrophaeus ATCC 9372]